MFKKTSAFTLIEVLVAAGLTAVVIIGCVYLIASSGRQANSIQELDEIKRLHSSYIACMQSENIRSAVGGGTYFIYLETRTGSGSGCKIGPVIGTSGTGNTIGYYQESNPGVDYKKKTFYGTFQAFTGSLAGEILIKERIEGPTLDKVFEYSVFQRED